MVTWLENSVIRTGGYQSSCSLCHPYGCPAWKAQSSPRAGTWCPTPCWKKCISRAWLLHPVRSPPNIHPGTFSYKNPHSALIVSQNFKLLIYFFSPLEINWVPDGNEIKNWEMLSTLKYTIYYAMNCILLLRVFCHYVILERVGFFVHVFFPPVPQGACST